MPDEVVRLLRCPICAASLHRDGGTLRCAAGHAYDLARHGYVSLLAGRAPAGDTAAMVADRETFLAAGHYDWLRDLLADRAAGLTAPGCVVDAGAGTGFYLAAVLERIPGSGLALDCSAYALRRAARAHPRIGAVRADLWRPLPVADGVARLVLNVFAPRNGTEFCRILAPGGTLVTVTPGPAHLTELVERLGLLRVDAQKQRRLADALPGWRQVTTSRHTATLTLDHEGVAALAGMGPSAWHSDPERLAAGIAALPPETTVTAECDLTEWRPT